MKTWYFHVVIYILDRLFYPFNHMLLRRELSAKTVVGWQETWLSMHPASQTMYLQDQAGRER